MSMLELRTVLLSVVEGRTVPVIYLPINVVFIFLVEEKIEVVFDFHFF